MRTELERARVGWSYAERSLRFYQADERNPVEKIDWIHYPSVKTDEQKKSFTDMMNRHMEEYKSLQKENGLETQDARNAIGPWFGTALQTSCNYRSLRDTMAVRLSSQAHPAWQDATRQIKELVTSIDPLLGEGITDICDIQGRCVWHSKLDRPCADCERRGRDSNHSHSYALKTKSGVLQCSCGELETEMKQKHD